MKALHFYHTLSLQDCPFPVRKAGESLIEVSLAGICNTDLEILDGYMNFSGILGHEFVGRVVESDTSNWIGRRVVGEINIGCGVCPVCRNGMQRHCPNRSVLGIQDQNGAFAQYLVLPDSNLHPIPDSISDQEAVFVEPLAAACEILEQTPVPSQYDVGVFGDGKLGILIALVLHAAGCQMTVIGKHPDKLNILQRFNIKTCLTSDITSRQFDMVVDATGSADGFHQALEGVKPRGIFVLKSTTHESIHFNPARLVIDEIRLLGSRCGPFEPAIRLLEEKKIDVLPLITGTYPLENWAQAFEKARSSQSMKILLSP